MLRGRTTWFYAQMSDTRVGVAPVETYSAATIIDPSCGGRRLLFSLIRRKPGGPGISCQYTLARGKG